MFFSDELSFESQADYVDMIGRELHRVYKHIKFNQARVAERNRAYQNDREGRYDVQFYRGDTVLLWVAGERPSRHQNHWNGPYRILKQLNAVEYLIEVPFKNTVQHRRVNVNRLRLYCFWEDGRPSVMRRDSLTEHERNKVQQFTKKANIGKMAVLPVEAMDENPPSFEIVKVLKRDKKGLLVQWFGNAESNPLGAHRPGWVDPKDNKHYYRARPLSKRHSAYTNSTSNTTVTDEMIQISGFDLTAADSILNLIHDSEH